MNASTQREFFIVETDVPLPPILKGRLGGRISLYPFAHMKKGASFRLNPAKYKAEHDVKGVRSAAYGYARNHGMKFSIRKMQEPTPDGGTVSVYRVFRVS